MSRRRSRVRRRTTVILLCMGAIVAAGCGADDERTGASSRGGPSAAEPALVEVPDVIGESADAAASTLRAEGLEPSFDREPDDRARCTVADQDQTGEVEKGSEVILTLECTVDVPDLSRKPADDAVSRLEKLGLAATYEEDPEDASVCTVESQDVVGEAEPESEVVLSLLCRLPDVTGKEVETAASALERLGYTTEHRRVASPSTCTVTSHRSHAEPGATIDLRVHCADGR